MTLLIAWAAGLLTLVNPCVLPVLPMVLASSLHHDRRAPLALALGMSLSFVLTGTAVTAIGTLLGLSSDRINAAAALVMAGFGLVMLFPVLGDIFSWLSAGVAARADASVDAARAGGLGGQVLAGALLGAVWSPCVGPTLGAAIGLAATGQDLGWAALVMLAFALGVSTLIVGLAYGARGTLARVMPRLRRGAPLAKPVMGAVFLTLGLGLYLGLNRPLEAWALDHLPPWLVDLSVSI